MKQGQVITGQMDDGTLMLRECGCDFAPAVTGGEAPKKPRVPHLTLMHPRRFDGESGKQLEEANSFAISGDAVQKLYEFLKLYYEDER